MARPEPQGERNLRERRGNGQSRLGGSAHLHAGEGKAQAWVLAQAEGLEAWRGNEAVCGAQCPGSVGTQARELLRVRALCEKGSSSLFQIPSASQATWKNTIPQAGNRRPFQPGAQKAKPWDTFKNKT